MPDVIRCADCDRMLEDDECHVIHARTCHRTTCPGWRCGCRVFVCATHCTRCPGGTVSDTDYQRMQDQDERMAAEA